MKVLISVIILLGLISCESPEPVVFIDEKQTTIEKLNSLDTSMLYSVDEWPAGVVPEKWKKHNDNGVIIVHTKEFNQKLENERYELLKQKVNEAISGNSKNMLFYFNGIKVPDNKLNKLTELMPSQLKSISIMDLESGRVYYKNEARAENIVINTKDFDTSLIEK